MRSNTAEMRFPASRTQRGAVLIVALMILLVMTLLGVASMNTSNMELVMAVNTQDLTKSFSDSENAVVDGETDLLTNFNGTPLFDWSAATTDGYYNIGDSVGGVASGSVLTDLDWTGANGKVSAPSGGEYTIEYLGPYTTTGASLTLGASSSTDRRYVFRVTGRGTFGRGGERYVQSYYATRD